MSGYVSKGSVISEVINGYNEIVSERDNLKLKAQILQQALHLANLMIVNGIKHNEGSRKKIKRFTNSSFLQCR